MGAFEHQIEELVAFARDRDNNDRSVLFCELTELFTSGTAPQAPVDREHLLDVIEALVPHVTPNTRAGVAGQLADMHHPPMDLVMRLIYDDADLVSNLIAHAPMDEDSLIEFIAKTGRAHHQELATRTDLSANVWIALARAAPTMPINRLHNENALWEDSLGKDHKASSSTHTKNAEELGINLFMTRPAPEEKITVRSATRTPVKNIKSIQKTHKTSRDDDDEEESDVFLNRSMAANDLVKNTLTRMEKRTLDAHVNHPMPKATTEQEDFNWDQHITSDLGWALLTGRDGKIADLSHSARIFMGPAAERLMDMDLIELIGLADRPEHPVVRAISRHGAIHDAPVVLFVGPVGRASWTLTALPKFEPNSGLFEGFNCHFSPVPVADEDIPVFLDEIDIDDDNIQRPVNNYKENNIASITGEVPIITETNLFLEDDDDDEDNRYNAPLTADPDVTDALAQSLAKNMNRSIDSIREQAKDMARERMSEIQKQLKGNEIKEWPKIITQATKYNKTPLANKDYFDDDQEQDVFADDSLQDIFEPAPIASTESIEKESVYQTEPSSPTTEAEAQPKPKPRIREKMAFKPLSNIQNAPSHTESNFSAPRPPAPIAPSAPQKSEDAQNPQQDALHDLVETTRLARQAIEAEENIQKMHVQRVATIKHMLSMMEEAGARLKDKKPYDDPFSIQLDSDIARTCAKALRDLLENKVEK